MPIDSRYKNLIVSNLPAEYREMYEAGEISDDQLRTWADLVGITPPAAAPRRGGLESRRVAAEKAMDRTIVDDVNTAQLRVATSGIGGLQRSAGAAGFRSADTTDPVTETSPVPLLTKYVVNPMSNLVGSIIGEEAVPADVRERQIAEYRAGSRLTPTTVEEELAILDSARQRISDQRQSSADLYQTGQRLSQASETLGSGIQSRVIRAASEPVADVAGSPSSLASVPGGLFGAIPLADVYNQEYTQARLAGLSEDEAKERARMMAAPEAISFLPTGGALFSAPARAALRPVLQQGAARVAGTAFKEGTEEAVTTALQEVANARLLESTSQRQSEYAAGRASVDIFEDMRRSFTAGALGGGALSTPGATFEAVAESGRRAAQVRRGDARFGAPLRAEADRAREAIVKKAEDVDRAYAGRGVEAPVSESTKAAEVEAGFRTMERQRRADAIIAQDPSNVMAQKLRDVPVTPGQVQAEQARAATAAEQEALKPYLDAANKDLTAAEKAATKKAKAAYQAAKRKEAQRLVDEAANLPAEQRAEFVARGRMAWDKANPAPVAAPTAPATATATQVAPPPSAAPAPSQAPSVTPAQTEDAGMSEDAIRQFGLSSQGATQGTGSTSRAVIDSIATKAGSSREAATLGRMIGDGRLVVVDSAQQLPNYDESLKNSNGFYDGERMYLVADQLDPDNIKGSLMVVAAHEGKHAADLSGAGRSTSMKDFIGEEANAKLNASIVAAARAGDKTAVRALDDAKKATATADGQDYDTMALELPAYYVSHAMASRATGGPLSGPLRTAVSAIRTKYREVFGNDDIDLRDVGYLANKLMEDIAVSNDSVAAAGAPALSMVVGPSHPSFQERKDRGLTFVDVDGKEKTLISDSGAAVNEDVVSRMENGQSVALSDLVSIPSIVKGYERIQNIPVYRADDLTARAEMRPTPDGEAEMYLSRELFNKAKTDPDLFRDTVLHEVQHLVQGVEDFARGGSIEEFMTSNARYLSDAYNRADKAYSDFFHDELTPDKMASAGIMSTTAEKIQSLKKEVLSGFITRTEFVEEVGVAIANDIGAGAAAIDMHSKLDKLTKTVIKRDHAARGVRHKAWQEYANLLGEREARFTADNSQRSQEELDAIKRPSYKGDVNIAYNAPGPIRKITLASMATPPGGTKAAAGDLVAEVKAALQGKRTKFTVDNTVGQFSGFGVLGRELGNIKELADGEAAAIAYVAAGDYHRVGFGVEKMSKRRGMKPEAAYAEVDDVLNKAAEISDVNAREAYIARYVESNKELRPLMDALAHISAQSKKIVAARVRDPRPLTEEERRKYGAIINNRFTYFNRTYAAFQGREGEVRNRRLQREAMIAKKQAAAGKTISPKYRNAYNTYNRAVRFIENNDLAVFDPQLLAVQPMDRIEYLYSTWVGNPQQLRDQIAEDVSIKGESNKQQAFRATAEAQIAAAGQNVKPESIRREAEYIVDSLLGLNDEANAVVSYYRGAKEDRSILKTKERIPAELRDLFGEVTDLPTKVAVTLAKQGELAARMRMLATIYENGNGKWFVDQETFRSSDEYADFTEQLNGEDWGPLNGVRMKPALAAALNDGLDVFTPLAATLAQSHATVDRAADAATGKLMRGVRWASSAQKFMQIVLSPFNTGVNFLGSLAVVAQNGGARPDDLLRAMKASAKMLNNQLNPGGTVGRQTPMVRDPDLEMFLKYTLLDSAVSQELRAEPSKVLKKLVVDLESATTLAQANKAVRTAMEKAGRAKSFTTELFALSDAWVKPAIFMSRVRFLENVNKAEGKNWSQDQIEQMAADMTKDTTITFQRAAPAVKLAERTALTWYAPYIQGVFRSTMYSYAQAYKDFAESIRATTPEGKLLYATEGAKRLVGAQAATAGAVLGTKWVSEALNDDDDEERIAAARKLLYNEGRYGDGIYLGDNANGYPVFMRLSRVDPNGPANDILRILLSDDDEETKTRAVVEHMKGLWIKPRTTADTGRLVLSMFSDEPIKNKKTKLERLFPATSLAFKNALPMTDYGTAESLVQLIDGFIPGVANAFDQEAATPSAESSDLTEKAVAAATLLTGGKVDVADPGMASFGAGNRLDTLQKEGRAQIFEALEISGPEAAMAKYADLREAELDAYAKLRDVYDGLVGMGYTPAQATAIMKDNKVQAQDIALIRKGRVPANATGLINADSIMKSGDFSDSSKTDEEKKAAKKAREDAVKKLELLEETMREEN